MSDIPFELFADLIYRLSHPKPPQGSTSTKLASPERVFAAWVKFHPKPLVSGTGKHLFRLLFPHEGSRRRYGFKETTLARELGKVLGIEGLDKWDSVIWEGGQDGGTGCLGKEVELLMKRRTSTGSRSTLSIREVDSLLDALASHSDFSQLSQPAKSPLTPSQILSKLYRDSSLSPNALCVLTQIILRDLRPLLNPLPQLPIRNPTAMLAVKSNAGPAQLSLPLAMWVWDSKMAEMYKGGKGSIDWCADKVEELGGGPGGKCRDGILPAGPIVGVNVQGHSVEKVLDEFCGNKYAPAASVVWAETKYDGYRMQIHVEIQNGQPIITIFSKSKRNSTLDRGNAHSIILASLGLPRPPNNPRHPDMLSRIPNAGPRLLKSIILEAEIVPYNEGQREGQRGPGIEEFWWLDKAGVIASDAPGFRFMSSRETDPRRHLCIAYFDILHLNGANLLFEPYSRRRQLLETAIRPIEGFALLCERTPIPLHLGRTHALSLLRSAFTDACNRREEGLVLKSAESTYNGRSTHRWVKLKKDYIPNLGDCVDLVLLGAGWDVDRARELRVDTSVYTTWYMGVLMNGDKVRKGKETPHFEVISRVSYGGTRGQLENWNANIRMRRWGTKPFDKNDHYKKVSWVLAGADGERLIGLTWTYFMPKDMTPPSVLFEQPLCAEIMGAGFQKLRSSELYEVRWPRLQKIHDPRERSWSEALDASALIQTAHQSLGYLPNDPHHVQQSQVISSQDSINDLWRTASTSAIDVLPDTPSPVKTSSRTMAKRVKSAPDLTEILKMSPPTPRRARPETGRTAASPLRMGVSPGRGAGQRMIDAIRSGGDRRLSRKDGGAVEVGGGLRTGEHLVINTPVSSPAKRLGSPIYNPSPVKRRTSGPSRQHGNLMEMALHLRTPPPTSPVLSSLDMNADIDAHHLDGKQASGSGGSQKEKEDKEDRQGGIGSEMAQMPVLASEAGVEAKKKPPWKKGQPMSLRSRIKLAMRGIVR